MPEPETPRGWRKRHPVLARVLLYAVLLGALAITAGLWLQARERYLWSRVDQISVEVSIDPSGGRALKSLDEEFGEWGILPNLALTDPLRARAERLRGVLARLNGDRAEVDRAFARARGLDPEPVAAAATSLEWTRCLLDLGDRKAAEALLAGPRPSDLTLGLWRDLLAAQLEEGGETAPARQRLLQALEALPRPLPKGPEVWFLLAPWRPAEVALEATTWVAGALRAPSPGLVPLWARLVDFAPDDADILLPATEALVAAGDRKTAMRSWRNLKVVSPPAAERAAKRNAALRELDTP